MKVNVCTPVWRVSVRLPNNSEILISVSNVRPLGEIPKRLVLLFHNPATISE